MRYDYNVYGVDGLDEWTEDVDEALKWLAAEKDVQAKLARYELVQTPDGFLHTKWERWQVWDGQTFGPWTN